jgi:uncharacterized protein DUF6292
MDLDLYGSPARGLRRYVWLVAEALGLGPSCCYVQLESPVQAYIPLDDRLPLLPGTDVAAVWDAKRGWAVGVEDGPDVVPLGFLGGELLPPPARAADFVSRFLAGEPFPEPDEAPPDDDLIDRLAGYATRFRGRVGHIILRRQ